MALGGRRDGAVALAIYPAGVQTRMRSTREEKVLGQWWTGGGNWQWPTGEQGQTDSLVGVSAATRPNLAWRPWRGICRRRTGTAATRSKSNARGGGAGPFRFSWASRGNWKLEWSPPELVSYLDCFKIPKFFHSLSITLNLGTHTCSSKCR